MAAGAGLPVSYRAASAEVLEAEGAVFDVVLNMEVVEHVADLKAYLRACARLVKPGGLMFVATLNKTLKSLALAKIGAEYILRWLPPGTHDCETASWRRANFADCLKVPVLNPLKTQGVAFDPLAWDWHLSSDVDVNYMVVASR
ncbi:MAG: bifunctional 2-polyprenyl-6-hydroxyphenol methylase/3-demethylubiquinol 3-O-methyltransferase UbiG [Rhizomicrobium sp.]